MAKKTKEINKILNLTKHQAKQILDMLEDLRNINSMTDDKCPIDYDMICKIDGMEQHGHYSRWSGSYEYTK